MKNLITILITAACLAFPWQADSAASKEVRNPRNRTLILSKNRDNKVTEHPQYLPWVFETLEDYDKFVRTIPFTGKGREVCNVVTGKKIAQVRGREVRMEEVTSAAERAYLMRRLELLGVEDFNEEDEKTALIRRAASFWFFYVARGVASVGSLDAPSIVNSSIKLEISSKCR